jgi:hypothetical protein
MNINFVVLFVVVFVCQHSASENRRRTRLRQKFSLLRETSECIKKDRFNILNTAIMKIQVNNKHKQQLEYRAVGPSKY